MRLDLGCGAFPQEGYEGVDIIPGADWQCDLEQIPWIFYPSPGFTVVPPGEFKPPRVPSDSVEAVYTQHLVEHIRDLVGFMGELWRVCKDGAEVIISHPYQFNVRAWQDPTHVRCLNEVSFFYFDKSWRGLNRDEFGPTDFEVVECDAIPTPEWADRAKTDPEEFERSAHNLINVIADLHWTLRARK